MTGAEPRLGHEGACANGAAKVMRVPPRKGLLLSNKQLTKNSSSPLNEPHKLVSLMCCSARHNRSDMGCRVVRRWASGSTSRMLTCPQSGRTKL